MAFINSIGMMLSLIALLIPEQAPGHKSKSHSITVRASVAHQGRGLGRALLRDALLRTLQAADIVGIRSLLVHAKDENARNWYFSWDFEPSPTDPCHLFLLLKDLKHILNG